MWDCDLPGEVGRLEQIGNQLMNEGRSMLRITSTKEVVGFYRYNKYLKRLSKSEISLNSRF